MKRWAVGYMNTYDNDLIVEIVTAPTWKDAILNHSKVGEDYADIIEDTIENTKQAFFNCDEAIGIVEIPQ